MAPMMVIAGGGLIVVIAQVVIQTKAPVQHLAMTILAWLTWLIVGAIATFIGTCESVRNLARYGLGGLIRPRWWFEVARVLWSSFLLGLLTLPLGFLSVDLTLVLAEILGTFGLFFATATVAYLLTIWRRKRFRGRAFEYVNFFYTIVGSVCLTGYSVGQWPPDNPLRGGVLVIIGILGISLMVAGFISIIILYEGRQDHK